MTPLAIPLERLAALFNRATPYRCTRTQRGVEFDVAGERLSFDEASGYELLESILVAIDAAPRLRRRMDGDASLVDSVLSRTESRADLALSGD